MKNYLFVIFILLSFSGRSADTLKISNDIYLLRVSEHCYVHTSFFTSKEYGRFGSNGMIVVNNNKAALFDTPMTDSLTEKLVNFIIDSLKCKIEFFVPNHWHNDCTEGIDIIDSLKIKIIASERTAEIGKLNKLFEADKSFSDTIQLRLDDLIIVCDYPGQAHTADNIVAWVESDKVLFGGCMIRAMETKAKGNIADANEDEWPRTIKKLRKKYKKAEIVIPGHGNYGDSKLLKHTFKIVKPWQPSGRIRLFWF